MRAFTRYVLTRTRENKEGFVVPVMLIPVLNMEFISV